MADRANPAIILGLGGTGQWVMTYVKKNLIDTYGKVPDTVRLLAFDTTGEESEAEIAAEKGEEQAHVADVTLGTGEFVYLGGNIRKICQEIKREGKHPHIGSWLQADFYLKAIDDDAYEIAKGAGQRRPFGRMAVFYDLATGQPKLTRNIEQAIIDVKGKEARKPIEIHIVSSLAGGTGAGMFIDVAHIARQLAERAGVTFALRGFIVLQNTFEGVIDLQDVLPNVFAAMRELDRFMLVFDRDYPIFYSEKAREPLQLYHGIYDSKLFDSCYLLDAKRPRLPLDGVQPKWGVFPAVAECITALLDPETESTFNSHYKNVANDLALAQEKLRQALYSSLGTFTYILPVRDIVERNAYKATQELLVERLLKVEKDATGKLRVTSEGNQEIRTPPREEAMTFLRMDKSRGNVRNVLFSQQVSLILASGRTRDPEFVREIADLGIEVLNWVLPVEQDDVIAQTADSIQRVMETNLIADVLNSKAYKDAYHSAADRIVLDVQTIRDELLGREEQGGRVEPGELQRGLAVHAQRNYQRFRRLLGEKMHDILNGITDDPLVAKSGKLPYGQEFLWWTVQAFDEFLAFMREVVRGREESGEMAIARDDVARTKQIMHETKDLTGPFDRLRGTAVRAQDDYIGAENYLLELERQEMLYRAVTDMATALKDIALESKAQVDHWVDLLVLGGAVDSGERGVYPQLLEETAQLQRRRDEMKRIKVYEYLTDDRYEDELYERHIGDKWPEILRRFRWELTDREGEGFRLHMVYGDAEMTPEAYRQESATVINTRFLMDHVRPYFQDIQRETIADRLKQSRMADGAAKEFLENASAMINFERSEHMQPEVEEHNFVCVNTGTQVQYMDELRTSLERHAPSAKDNQVIGLTNKHRCIVLSTTDLLIGENTDPCEAVARAYMDHTGDLRLLHCFPAEVNASGYEQRLPRAPIYEERRWLSPLLVSLMEDSEMVRRFVLGLAYGLIREEEAEVGGGQNEYVLRLDRIGRRDQTYRIRLTQPNPRPNLVDAMSTFVYPKIDPETGARRIMDVTPGMQIGMEPRRVDEALRLMEESLKSGREAIVEEFQQLLSQNAYLLTDVGEQALVGAFRRFLDKNEKVVRRGKEEELREKLDEFIDGNSDCIETDHRDQILGKVMSLLRPYQEEGKIVAGGNLMMAQRLEQHIQREVEPRHKEKSIRGMPEDKRPDQLTQDLYAIMHMILWYEVERLERLAETS